MTTMPTPAPLPPGDFVRFDAVVPVTLRLHRESGVETVSTGHALLLRSTETEQPRLGLTLVQSTREFLVTPGSGDVTRRLIPGDELLTPEGEWTILTATLRPRLGLWHAVCQSTTGSSHP